MRRQRVQLTDQALVAVEVARATASGREPSAGDLLVGLLTEPDGAAGRWLRADAGAALRLSSRASAAAPALPSLSAVVAAAAARAHPRPPATVDLLAATLSAGGDDVDDLLDACGYAAPALRAAAARAEAAAGDETVTLDGEPALRAEAGRIVGRARARAGGAIDVVMAIAESPDHHVAGLVSPADPDTLAAARALLETGGVGDDWDRGLDQVLRGAATLAAGRPVEAPHLLQAAVVGGGRGPLAVLEAARRIREDGAGCRD